MSPRMGVTGTLPSAGLRVMGFCLEQGHVIDATFYKREQFLFSLVFD